MKASTMAIIGGGALAAGWAIMKGMEASADRRRELVIDLQTRIASSRLPFRVRRWAQSLAASAAETVPRGVDPYAWALVGGGIMDRESGGGELLRPATPAGTGDPDPRSLARIRRDDPGLEPFVRVVGSGPEGPTVMPADGGGWGRGLMQIDFQHAFARTGDWRDPAANIRRGLEILATEYEFWRDYPDALRLAAASYNARRSNVLAAVLRGADPDSVTTGKNYSADVLRRAGEAMV